jgi:hypothetical protein
MRTAAAAALAFALLASPAFAKSKSSTATKGPRVGQFCSKAAVGTTAQDAKGPRWSARPTRRASRAGRRNNRT